VYYRFPKYARNTWKREMLKNFLNNSTALNICKCIIENVVMHDLLTIFASTESHCSRVYFFDYFFVFVYQLFLDTECLLFGKYKEKQKTFDDTSGIDAAEAANQS